MCSDTSRNRNALIGPLSGFAICLLASMAMTKHSGCWVECTSRDPVVPDPWVLAQPYPVPPECIVLVPVGDWCAQELVADDLTEPISPADSALAPVRLGMIKRIAGEIYQQGGWFFIQRRRVNCGHVELVTAREEPARRVEGYLG